MVAAVVFCTTLGTLTFHPGLEAHEVTAISGGTIDSGSHGR